MNQKMYVVSWSIATWECAKKLLIAAVCFVQLTATWRLKIGWKVGRSYGHGMSMVVSIVLESRKKMHALRMRHILGELHVNVSNKLIVLTNRVCTSWL